MNMKKFRISPWTILAAVAGAIGFIAAQRRDEEVRREDKEELKEELKKELRNEICIKF